MSDVDFLKMYEAMRKRIFELPNTPASMQILFDEFLDATPEDWWMVFDNLGIKSIASMPLSWQTAEIRDD